ncbi:MAG: DUF1059 domain-containing protein [Anaerolineae bacterium]
MAVELKCADLGIAGCNTVFHGETPAEAIEELRKHLKAEHDVNLPEADIILKAEPNWDLRAATDSFMRDGYDRKEITIIRRLRTMFEVSTQEQARRQEADF